MKTLWLLIRRTVQEYGDDNCSHMAAAISYYVLFSIIPLAIFTVSIFGLVVRDADLHREVCGRIGAWLAARPGWCVLGVTESPVTGPSGNKEFLIGGRLDTNLQ